MNTTTSVRLSADSSVGSVRMLVALYALICFCAGAAMMVIELAGIRLLSPMFGNSLFTWTALIGVILIAFSCGGFLGGWLADRSKSPKHIAVLLYCAALSTLIVPPVHALSTLYVGSLGIVAGPTVLSLILFTIPGCFLGAVSPYATRLLAHLSGDTRIGFAAGTVNMSGALGSMIGTFASGFVLIPLISIRYIFLGVTATLLLLGVLVYCSSRTWPARDKIALSVAALLMALVMFLGIRVNFPNTVIDSRMSSYQQVLVMEEINDEGQTVRRLLNDRAQQGALILETGKSPLPYQHYWHLSQAYLSTLTQGLVFGGGTFGIPKDLAKAWPDAEIVTLEIDSAVVEMAHKHFFLSESDRVTSVTEDARYYLNRTDGKFDVVFGDAFAAEHAIPAHLTTREFFQQIKSRLAPGGIYMMNIIGTLDGPGADVFTAVHTTLRSVFNETHVYRAYPRANDELNNLIVVAADQLVDPASLDFTDGALSELLKTRVAPSLLERVGTVLSDDHNPIEYLVTRSLSFR